ncbi:hypothetical protein PVAND_010766 [Polypedilum vanderplanki]|uniref:Nucleolar protein 4 helical domain-containing protein n=1 Tax=Polypedilum vanderplanki TaxID=319348 RepID=A0A9J6CH98_POLVA|nr:hypothetical protein PVAND_010766 [Polypedilum vanderplanki]
MNKISNISSRRHQINSSSACNKIESHVDSNNSSSENDIKIAQQQHPLSNTFLLNCDNKINQGNRYDVSNGLFSGHSGDGRKLSIDDESSHPINASNTNNKSERKRNINMLDDIQELNCSDVSGNGEDCGVSSNSNVIVSGGNTKRMKVDCDGQDNNKSKMYQIYQPWVLRTYGDQSKSKTITLKKQSRIVSTLKGLESNRPDSSKFRFWVKSKGFITELPIDHKNVKHNKIDDDGCMLYIPCKSDSSNISSYKRVAVVEYFFNIIYKVHCSVDEGEGRHVGQKRTYRKITEYYAFLPREAVTKFLTQCNECRRSMKTTIIQDISEIEQKVVPCNNVDNDTTETTNQQKRNEDYPKNIENYYLLLKALYENSSLMGGSSICEDSFKENIARNENIEIKQKLTSSKLNDEQSLVSSSTTAINNVMTRAKVPDEDYDESNSSTSLHNNNNNHLPIKQHTYHYDDDIRHTTCINSISSRHTDGAKDISSHYHTTSSIDSTQRTHLTGDIKPITSTYLLMTRSMGLTDEDALNLESISSSQSENNHDTATLNLEDSYANLLKDTDKLKLMLLAWNYQNSAAIRNNASGPDLSTMANLWEQYQNALTGMGVNKNGDGAIGSPSPSQSQDDANSPSDNNKEEDEGSEDESDERIDQTSYDPERLKAFNMFVRLFVDENLDRMIPISKQPKEKVQAIIDSCARQFPEFSERARKRLRTYLKSCRRNKKTKDGWENQPSRPTPAHLTSVQAEQILAIACENESLNAKRMRLGMEPISQALNIPSSHSSDSQSAPSLYTMAKSSTSTDPTIPLTISTNVANCKTSPIITTTTDSNANSINSILTASRSALPTTSAFDFGQAFLQKSSQNSAYYTSPIMNNSTMPQGPTDLSIKRPLLPHNLNVTEAAAVKQLITGYREAAAFLLRSADELEQLLLNQQT